MTENEALIILNNIPTLGPVRIRALIAHFGSALEVLESEQSALKNVKGLGEKLSAKLLGWRALEIWQRDLALLEQTGASVVTYKDAAYPTQLKGLPDAPIILYYFGDLGVLERPCAAVIGTRNPSRYGADMARVLGRDLAAASVCVVSGLARGIDTEAHLGALGCGVTAAVIGSGLTQVYPKENVALARDIAEKGVVLSEFPLATPPDRQNFPQRNRIVSGLSQALLLVEAPVKSGAMLTMERGRKQERDCYALPGRADMESFRGNHSLIKTGRAQLIENARDLKLGAKDQKVRSGGPEVTLSQDERTLLGHLEGEERSFDEVAALVDLPIAKLNVLLMGLILKQVIKEYPGKLYKKVMV